MDSEQIRDVIEKGLVSLGISSSSMTARQANTLFRWWEMMGNTRPLLADKGWWEYYTDDVMRN